MPDYHKITDLLSDLKDCFVAGGAITSLYTNKPINDFDIYPKSSEGLENAIAWGFSHGFNAHVSSRSSTFVKGEEWQVQVMHFDTFPTAESIFECFDFTVCMGAFDLDSRKFILHENFLEHCSQRFLKFNPKTRFPYATGWRVRKYEERGFTIGRMEFQKILMACAEKPIRSWDDLKDQIGGVYGESFEIPTEGEFSTEAAYKALGTLKFEKGNQGYANVDEAILALSNEPKQWFSTSSGQYFVKLDDDEAFSVVKHPPKVGVKLTPEQVTDLSFYKKVASFKEGIYQSVYSPSFLYRIGETVSAGTPHIFCYQTLKEAAQHFGGDRVIELKPTCPDDIVHSPGWSMGKQQLKKCRVIREVPEGSWRGK